MQKMMPALVHDAGNATSDYCSQPHQVAYPTCLSTGACEIGITEEALNSDLRRGSVHADCLHLVALCEHGVERVAILKCRDLHIRNKAA